MLTDGSSGAELKNTAVATLPNDSKSAVKRCEHRAKQSKLTHQCKAFLAAPSIKAFLALLPDWGYFKSGSKAIALDNQCTFELAAETTKLG